jgi:hypothetical protein
MTMWTEITGENTGVVHVDGRHVIFPIFGFRHAEPRVMEQEVREVTDMLERREAAQRVTERLREVREGIEEQQRARERIKDAGYDMSEVPL